MAVQGQAFDNKGYLKRRFTATNGIIDEERGVQPFYLKCYHHFYQTFNHSWDPTKASLLELGGGPVIYPLISATPYVTDITFADYSEEHLEEVNLWVSKDSEAHDWTPYFDHVVGSLEGNIGESLSRQDELRSKIKRIVPCDLQLKDSSKMVNRGDCKKCFDIVSFNFCAEVLCQSTADYVDLLSHVKDLVSPNGYLTSLISLEESWYRTDVGKSYVFYITAQQAADCFEKAGFSVEYKETFPITEKAQDILNDCKGIMFISGKNVQ